MSDSDSQGLLLSNFKPSKSKGQNFLVSQDILKKISETVLGCNFCIEIGPGTGNLTKHILGRTANLFCIEKDKNLYEFLSMSKFVGNNKITIVNGDAVCFDFFGVYPNQTDVKIVGNLPYSCATDILFNVVIHNEKFDLGVFMMQREAVVNICSNESTGCQDLTGMFVKSFYKVDILFDVSRECFRPKPKIMSTVFKIERIFAYSKEESLKYLDFLKKTFSFRRKTLLNNIKFHFSSLKQSDILPILESMGYGANVRAMDIKAEHYFMLYKKLQSFSL